MRIIDSGPLKLREKLKVKLYCNKSRKLKGKGMLDFHPYFDIQLNLDVRVASSTRRKHFTPKEIPW
jgi:hypothetical protein